MGAVCLLGDRAWWLWAAVPLYSVWLAWTTLMGVRSGITDIGGAAGAAGAIESKRQKKMEKRGGQRVVYR
jgi:SRP-independent targeting protein 2/TMEM208